MLLSWDGFQMKVDNGIVRLIKYSHGMKDILVDFQQQWTKTLLTKKLWCKKGNV